MKKNRRKLTWVLSSFQRWFVVSFLLYSALFFGLVALGITTWFGFIARQYVEMAGLLSPAFLAQIQRSVHTGVYFLAGLVALQLMASLVIAIQFGRRLAGPIYAVTRNLKNYSETGTWTSLDLRDGDCFGELASELNRAFEVKLASEKKGIKSA